MFFFLLEEVRKKKETSYSLRKATPCISARRHKLYWEGGELKLSLVRAPFLIFLFFCEYSLLNVNVHLQAKEINLNKIACTFVVQTNFLS